MHVDILILSQLLHGPKHGYDIKRHIEAVMCGDMMLNNNLLYPALKRFENLKAIRRSVIAQIGRPRKFVYSLTPEGRKRLKALASDFPPSLATNRKEFFIRCFSLAMLGTESAKTSMMKILKIRKEFLMKKLHSLKTDWNSVIPSKNPILMLFKDFLSKRVSDEFKMIEKMERSE